MGEADLYAPLHTTANDGTDPEPITDYLKGVRGLSAEFRVGATARDPTAAIDRGEPPPSWTFKRKDESRTPDVAEWAADWDDGHYALLVGYDARELYFMDPSTSLHYAHIPRGEIEARWHARSHGVERAYRARGDLHPLRGTRGRAPPRRKRRYPHALGLLRTSFLRAERGRPAGLGAAPALA